MKSRKIPVITVVASLAALGGMALAAQDKDPVQVPGGLAFFEFREYERWQAVAVSQPEDRLNLIVANPVMIEAYRAAFPATGSLSPMAPRLRRSPGTPNKMQRLPFP
jgi:hypothetical protein